MRAVPGVEAVGSASAGPLFGGRETWQVELQGVAGTGSVRWYDVSPGFFRTLGLPILLGRDLGREDVIGAPFSVLVNESLVARYWRGENPLGRQITFGVGADRAVFQVVGLVPDIPPMSPNEPVEPQMSLVQPTVAAGLFILHRAHGRNAERASSRPFAPRSRAWTPTWTSAIPLPCRSSSIASSRDRSST